MIANGCDDLDRALSRFRDEVLRWNAGFSLISRIDTEQRLESLIDESVASFGVLKDEVLGGSNPVHQDGPRRIQYVDLGSGAGFPGLLWHLLWVQNGIPGVDHAGSLLVEPRDKRAWFLEHMAGLWGLEGLEVGMDQWGRRTGLRSDDESERITGLVTLKALHLTDEVILDGWRKYRGVANDALIICRFHPPAIPLDGALREKYHLPEASSAPGEPHSSMVRFEVGSKSHALLLSVYPCI
jgi:hypothetical protein